MTEEQRTPEEDRIAGEMLSMGEKNALEEVRLGLGSKPNKTLYEKLRKSLKGKGAAIVFSVTMAGIGALYPVVQPYLNQGEQPQFNIPLDLASLTPSPIAPVTEQPITLPPTALPVAAGATVTTEPAIITSSEHFVSAGDTLSGGAGVLATPEPVRGVEAPQEAPTEPVTQPTEQPVEQPITETTAEPSVAPPEQEPAASSVWADPEGYYQNDLELAGNAEDAARLMWAKILKLFPTQNQGNLMSEDIIEVNGTKYKFNDPVGFVHAVDGLMQDLLKDPAVKGPKVIVVNIQVDGGGVVKNKAGEQQNVTSGNIAMTDGEYKGLQAVLALVNGRLQVVGVGNGDHKEYISPDGPISVPSFVGADVDLADPDVFITFGNGSVGGEDFKLAQELMNKIKEQAHMDTVRSKLFEMANADSATPTWKPGTAV